MSYYERNKDKWKEYSRISKEQKKLTSYPLIYKLECHITGLIYIGKTTQKIYDRKGKHMWDYRNRKDVVTAHKVMENDNWDIYEIERVDDKSKLSEREQYWIDNTECVNKLNAIQKISEKEARRRYWNNHNDRLLLIQRNKRHYRASWGGDERRQNNLLLISPDLFVNANDIFF